MDKGLDKDAIRQKVRDQLAAMNVPYVDDLTEAYFERGPSVLAQAVFVHAAWQEVIQANDSSWIDTHIRVNHAGIGELLQQLLEVGATREQLSQLVRYMQKETLMGLCCLVDNTPGLFSDPVNPKLHWHLSLFEMCPSESLDLGGVHEVVGDFDPSGEEGGGQMG